MYLGYVFNFLAIVVFGYLVWKKLRDDLDKEVNDFIWLSGLAFAIGGRIIWSVFNLNSWSDSLIDWIFFWQKPGFYWQAGVVSMIGFVFAYSFVDRFSFYELAEDICSPLLISLTISRIVPALTGSVDQIRWLAILVATYLFGFWAKRYRSFYWYKSGKKGFLFLASGWFLSWIRFGTDILAKEWNIGTYLSLTLGLIFLIGLVMLGELFGHKRNE